MTTVPIYYLRSALYLILSHAKTIAHVQHSEYIEEFDANTRSKPSEEEATWLGKKNYHIEKGFDITNRNVGKVWKAIQDYWESNKLATDLTQEEKDNINKLLNRRTNDRTKIHLDCYAIFTEYCDFVNGQYKPKKSRPVFSKAIDFRVDCTLAIGVCLLAKHTVSDNDKTLEFLEKVIKEIKQDRKQADEIPSEQDFWNLGSEDLTKITPLFNTHWECYERTDGIVPHDAKWGIAQSYIHIKAPNEQGIIPIVMSSHYPSGKHTHKGKLTLEANRHSLHLIAHLTREEKDRQTLSFFVMRLNYSSINDHHLIMGFHLAFSPYYGRYLTKSVIWLNRQDSTEPISLSDKRTAFKTTFPQAIRTFLYDRHRNRLTMPSTDFFNSTESLASTDLNSLEKWLEARDSALINDYILKGCAVDYYVFYNFCSDPTLISKVEDIANYLRMDVLSIQLNQDSAEFEAHYKHRRFTIKTNVEPEIDLSSEDTGAESKAPKNKIITRTYEETNFEGLARRHRSTIQLLFDEQRFVDRNGLFSMKTPYGNFVHLTFGVPEGNNVAFVDAFNKREYFEGIASGLNDDNNDPVSFRILLMRKEKLRTILGVKDNADFEPVDYIDTPTIKRICSYFYSYKKRSSIIVETSPFHLLDRFPFLEKVRNSNEGEFELKGVAGKFRIKVKYKNEEFNDEDLDLNKLLARAEAKAKGWFLSNK